MSFKKADRPRFTIGWRNRRRMIAPVLEHRRPEDYEAEKMQCTIKPECKGCSYAAHGFLCHTKDGRCLRTGYTKPNDGNEE